MSPGADVELGFVTYCFLFLMLQQDKPIHRLLPLPRKQIRPVLATLLQLRVIQIVLRPLRVDLLLYRLLRVVREYLRRLLLDVRVQAVQVIVLEEGRRHIDVHGVRRLLAGGEVAEVLQVVAHAFEVQVDDGADRPVFVVLDQLAFDETAVQIELEIEFTDFGQALFLIVRQII